MVSSAGFAKTQVLEESNDPPYSSRHGSVVAMLGNGN
jgi:hypothetical protein